MNIAIAETRIPNRTILVLGMHRSGTSALTGSLEQAGVTLGKVMTHSFDNIKGSRENKSIQTIHEDLLVRAGGSWRNPSVDVKWHPIHNAFRNSIIDSYANEPIWGFKDPRTLFTLNGWLEVMPHLELLATFRHPFRVAQSLKQRNEISYEESLNLWITYNSKLLEQHEAHGKFPLIEFAPDNPTYHDALCKLIESLSLDSSGNTFIDASLSTSHIPDLMNEPGAKAALLIYEQLQNICSPSAVKNGSNTPQATTLS